MNAVAFVIMVVLIAIAPFFAYPFFVMQAMCFALFACAFNLLIGYANLLSLGHAMFFGLASYACAHAAKVWGLEPISAIAVGVEPPPSARHRSAGYPSAGIYFAMITMAFSQMVFFFASSCSLTARMASKRSCKAGRFGFIDLSNPWILYCFVAVIFLFGFFVVQRAVNSPSAKSSKRSAKTNPARCRSAIARFNMLAAFVLSAVIAALPGRPRRSSSRTRQSTSHSRPRARSF